MECAEIHITVPSRSDCIKLVFLGDLHLGHAQTDEGLIRQVAERLGEKYTYWIDLGDACDFINLRDPRFDPGGLPDWIGVEDLADLPAAQIVRYRDIFGRLGDTCLVRLAGNHEDSIRRHYERDVYRELNAAVGLYDEPRSFELAAGTRALDYSGFVRLRMYRGGGMSKGPPRGPTWTLTLFVHHGAGGGQLAGAKALRLERLPLAFDADIYAVGHTHTKLTLQKRLVGLGPRGLYPQGLGPIEVWLYPDKKKLRVIE